MISNLQIHIAQKSFSYLSKVTKKGLVLLKLLEKLSLIRSYYLVKGNTYRIFPFYTKNYKLKRGLRLYLRKSYDLQISLRSLYILNKTALTSHFVIETDLGVLTHREALYRKRGGKLILTVL